MNRRKHIQFESLRDDWVKGADLVARLIDRSASDGSVLVGFPRQWIPVFIHFKANWAGTVAPSSYLPMATPLSEPRISKISYDAERHGALRPLVEAFASLDPLIADVLYRLDRRKGRNPGAVPRYLPLTGWQSYGRPEILAFTALVERTATATSPTAVLLPCARKRPYSVSKTHQRIWRHLKSAGVDRAGVDEIVVSSIGIVPKTHWDHPVVRAYDSGVPDIYRTLRLMRLFFRKCLYKTVIDCLEFKPYSDCLKIVAREGFVGEIRSELQGKARSLPAP